MRNVKNKYCPAYYVVEGYAFKLDSFDMKIKM